jgi:hypothetical protein
MGMPHRGVRTNQIRLNTVMDRPQNAQKAQKQFYREKRKPHEQSGIGQRKYRIPVPISVSIRLFAYLAYFAVY